MATKTVFGLFSLCLLSLSAACTGEPLPTSVPAATLPPEMSASPTGNLPPTRELNPPTSTPVPTAVPPTPEPTATPTAVDAVINITVPEAEADLVLESTVEARGLVQRDPSHTVRLALVSANGRLLAEAEGTVGEVGWEGSFTIPPFVSGAARVQASVLDEAGVILAQDQVPVNLVLDTDGLEQYLALFRPNQGETAVAGFNIFFDGRAERPVNNTVTISIWTEDCQNEVARQNFVLRGSGYWQGFVVVPPDTAGTGCAVAYFGTPGEETWREAQVPITILAPEDGGARGVEIGNPPPNSTVTAGQELFLYGTALNAPEEQVQVSVILENGRVVSQGTAISDYWGYWELPLTLPFDVEGPAEITAVAGAPDDAYHAETSTLITIEPAPTPTPMP